MYAWALRLSRSSLRLGIAMNLLGDQGVVMVRDAAKIEPFKLRNVTKIPEKLSDYNKDQIAKPLLAIRLISTSTSM